MKFFEKHTIRRLFLSVCVFAILVYVVKSIPSWKIQKETTPDLSKEAKASGKEIGQKGIVTVAENNGSKLLLDTENLILTVQDATLGQSFSSAVNNADKGTEIALLSVSYLGKDNNLYEWNSYDNCVAFSTYQMYQIENGVQIVMNLNEGESNRFYEYLPKKMSVETYQEVFKAGIEKLGEDGTWDEQKVKRYLQTLSLVYKKSIMENCYAVTYTGNPPVSAVNQMIEIAKAVGYTQDMLVADGEAFGFQVTFSEAANLDITLEAVLEDGDLVVSLPGLAMNSENDFYTIQNIKVLPNFGAVDATQEGYIFVPDGTGALFAFNSNVGNIKNYERPIYDNDFLKDYYYMPEFSEELFMPVYGMLYGSQNDADKGFLAIVEDGARNAYVHVRLAGKGADSSKYNKVFASFDTTPYKKVKINGEYSSSTANYLVDTGMQPINYQLRFQFFGKHTSYFAFAKSYQEYLAESLQKEIAYDDGKATIFMEVIGALSIEKKLAGIPYDSVYSMTEYDELTAILKDLEGVNLEIQYDGVFNEGLNNKLNTKAQLVSQNGNKKEFEALQSYVKENDIPFYYQVALSNVGAKGNGFVSSKHAVRDYANEEVEITRHTPVLGIMSGALSKLIGGTPSQIVSPAYLSYVTDQFLKDAKSYDSLAITDLASMHYADYRFRSFIWGEQGNAIIEENLEKLSKEKTLVLKNPHMDKIGYGSVATDISRESSNYLTFDQTIPFRQLVLNGLISYTTENVNLSSKNKEHYILQMAELQAWPKFYITAKSVNALKDTAYNYLYSVSYDNYQDEIKEVYDTCVNISNRIGTNEITDHKVLQEQVFETTYANGTKVIVNYNLYDVTLQDGTVLLAEDYLIKEGK